MPIPTRVRTAVEPSKNTKLNPPHHDGGGFNIIDSKPGAGWKPSVAVMDFFSKDKRHSIGRGGKASNAPGKGSPKGSPKLTPAKSAKLAVDMESPPLVFYGSQAQSSGALLSGQLILTVTDPEIVLQTFEMVLLARVTIKRPVSKDCPQCQIKGTEIFTWKFLREPNRFKKGTHTFPFSYLLPGHLPATSHGDLGSIDYVLDGKALTSMADTIPVSRTLTVQRALMPGGDKTSLRIFPPTNISVRVSVPGVIYPIGEFPVRMTVTGIIDHSLKNIERRWRIRRIIWKIEEHSKIISPACPKHAHKIGGEGKGVLHEDARTLASDEIKSGWKTDFDTAGGEINMEFMAAPKPNPHPICDVDSPTGLAAHHNLVLEIIVAEEQTAGKHGKGATPTGGARVLRMQFKLTLTERAGMGISWDEEMPPMYEDVPSSPPGYLQCEEFEGELPADEELEHMGR